MQEEIEVEVEKIPDLYILNSNFSSRVWIDIWSVPGEQAFKLGSTYIKTTSWKIE